MTRTIMRVYKFFAFPPKPGEGLDAFNAVQPVKQDYWRMLVEINDQLVRRDAGFLAADPTWSALSLDLQKEPGSKNAYKALASRAAEIRKTPEYTEH